MFNALSNLFDVAWSAGHMKAMDVKTALRNRFAPTDASGNRLKLHCGATGIAPYLDGASLLKK